MENGREGGISQKLSSLDPAHFHKDINQLKLRLQPKYYWISALKSQNEKKAGTRFIYFLNGVATQSSRPPKDLIPTHSHKKILMELRAIFFFNKILVNIYLLNINFPPNSKFKQWIISFTTVVQVFWGHRPFYKFAESLGPSAQINTQIQDSIKLPWVHRPSKVHMDPPGIGSCFIQRASAFLLLGMSSTPYNLRIYVPKEESL